ncbi:uncharacterized protein [Nicotiana tomentosiformis]|uniref:uncharacterized protein n=1 Tax=Nicotiana tomentosiformis TaxID=4098 RepID=UPI00051BD7A3
MARDVLAVPVSSVASECAFSTGGRLLDSFRSSLTPKLVQALVCLQDWLRNEKLKQLVSVKEDIDKIEQLEQVAKSNENENLKQIEAIQLWNEVQASMTSDQSVHVNNGRKSWVDEIEEATELQGRKSSPKSHGESAFDEIELDDIKTEVEYWGNAVICYVLEAHPQFSVIQGYIQRLCGKLSIDRIAMLKNRVIVVRFNTIMGKQEVIEGSIYHFDNKPFIVKAWTPELEFTREELQTVPIWIKLSGLDFKHWSPRGLSKIGSLVGKPLMVDQNTERKECAEFC